MDIIYATKTVIISRIIKVWSWKKMSCSIRGDDLFCKFKLDHVAIY